MNRHFQALGLNLDLPWVKVEAKQRHSNVLRCEYVNFWWKSSSNGDLF